MESRNNVNYTDTSYVWMPCPNRWKLKPKNEYADQCRYEAKKARKYPECPSGIDGKVDMIVIKKGIWTTIECPICGYTEAWSIGDGDELF